MKLAILAVLLVIAALLVAIVVLLFVPGNSYNSAQPSLRSRQAAVGRAVLQAARHDPAVAAMVRAAVQAASEDDWTLAPPCSPTFSNPDDPLGIAIAMGNARSHPVAAGHRQADVT